MKVRETKYASGKEVLTAVQWNGGMYLSYEHGKLNSKDMPDEESRILAELIEMYMTLAGQLWGRLKVYLEGMPDGEPSS